MSLAPSGGHVLAAEQDVTRKVSTFRSVVPGITSRSVLLKSKEWGSPSGETFVGAFRVLEYQIAPWDKVRVYIEHDTVVAIDLIPPSSVGAQRLQTAIGLGQLDVIEKLPADGNLAGTGLETEHLLESQSQYAIIATDAAGLDGNALRVRLYTPNRNPDDSDSSTPWIGAYVDAVRSGISSEIKRYHSNGVKILGLDPDGPAARAGLLKNDIVLRVGDRDVVGVEHFDELISSYSPGDQVRVSVRRNGTSFYAMPTLIAQPGILTQLQMLKQAAERGEAWAQSRLGTKYAFGNDVPKDDQRAVELYLAAAEDGDMWAQSNLGARYAQGRGVPKDDREAVKWFRKSAAKGHAVGESGLGWMLANGLGIDRNDAEAVRWYRAAIENPYAYGDEYQKGSVYAQSNLASMYEEGRGVPKDLDEAHALYRKAAASGLAEAQFSLGRLFYHGIGVPVDYSEAMKWFYEAAKQNHVGAATSIGLMALNGEGVKKNYDRAMEWFRVAAKANDPAAQNAIGVMYLNGWGVAQDREEAVKWLQNSAAQGFELAKQNLRDIGVAPTPKK